MFLISKDFSEILLLILLGFVQFIESTPVAEVLDKDVDGSIQVEFKTIDTLLLINYSTSAHWIQDGR